MSGPEQCEIGKVPQEAIFNYIDGVGNHERKLATASIVLAEPTSQFTAARLAHEINTRQGDHPAWNIGLGEVDSYCVRSLQPIGAIIIDKTTTARGHVVNSYRANPENLEAHLALTGFLEDWSLQYAATSLQQLFGATVSSTDARSPSTRYQIYLALLTGNEGLSIFDLEKAVGKDSFHGQVKSLENNGIISTQTKLQSYNPKLRVADTEFRHTRVSFDKLRPETQVLYQVIDTLGVGREIVLEELLEIAKTRQPDIDIVKLRQSVIQSLHWQGLPGLKFVSDDMDIKSKRSSVHLNPELAEAIAELTYGIESIKDGNKITEYTQTARDMLGDEQQFRALIAKAKHFSTWSGGSKGHQEARDHLLAMATTSGKTTVGRAIVELERQCQRPLSEETVRTILNNLVSTGSLIVARETDSYTNRKRNVYRPKS